MQHHECPIVRDLVNPNQKPILPMPVLRKIQHRRSQDDSSPGAESDTSTVLATSPISVTTTARGVSSRGRMWSSVVPSSSGYSSEVGRPCRSLPAGLWSGQLVGAVPLAVVVRGCRACVVIDSVVDVTEVGTTSGMSVEVVRAEVATTSGLSVEVVAAVVVTTSGMSVEVVRAEVGATSGLSVEVVEAVVSAPVSAVVRAVVGTTSVLSVEIAGAGLPVVTTAGVSVILLSDADVSNVVAALGVSGAVV